MASKMERSFAITVTSEDVDKALADGNIDEGQRLAIMREFTDFVGFMHRWIEEEMLSDVLWSAAGQWCAEKEAELVAAIRRSKKAAALSDLARAMRKLTGEDTIHFDEERMAIVNGDEIISPRSAMEQAAEFFRDGVAMIESIRMNLTDKELDNED